MGVGAGLYMYVVVVQKFTFAISSPDEFLSQYGSTLPHIRTNFVRVINLLSGALQELFNFSSNNITDTLQTVVVICSFNTRCCVRISCYTRDDKWHLYAGNNHSYYHVSHL